MDAASAPAPVVKAAKAVRKPKVAPNHPPFKALIKAAIVALKERTGSSVAAIKKWFAGWLPMQPPHQGPLSSAPH